MHLTVSELPSDVRAIAEEIAARLEVETLTGIEVNLNTGFAALTERRPTHDPFQPGISAEISHTIGRSDRRVIIEALRPHLLRSAA